VRPHGGENRPAKVRGRRIRPALQDGAEALFVERRARRVLGLGNAITVQQQHVARHQHRLARLVPAHPGESQGRAAGQETLDLAARPAQQRRQVSCVDVGEQTAGGVEDAEEERDEPGRRGVACDLGVQALDERRRGQGLVEQGPQHGEEQRHQEGRRTALAGDVSDGDDKAAIVEGDDFVEVAAHRVGRPRRAEGLDPRGPVRVAAEHGFLDVAGHLQVVLQRQAVRDLEDHEQVHEEEARDEQQRAVAPGGNRDRNPEQPCRHAGHAEAGEELEDAQRGQHEARCVEDPARRGQPHREGQEEGAQRCRPPPVPRERGERLLVEPLCEEAVGGAGVAGEEPRQLLRAEVAGVCAEDASASGRGGGRARRHARKGLRRPGRRCSSPAPRVPTDSLSPRRGWAGNGSDADASSRQATCPGHAGRGAR
jgi:hypothetical protein